MVSSMNSTSRFGKSCAKASAMLRDLDEEMDASLDRMLSSLRGGMTVWDDVCFLVSEMVGMKINVLSAVDSVDVLQVAHFHQVWLATD